MSSHSAEHFEGKIQTGTFFSVYWSIGLHYRHTCFVFCLSRQSVLQRQVCWLFISLNGEFGTEMIRSQRCCSAPGTAVMATVSLTQEMKRVQHSRSMEGTGSFYLHAQYAPEDAGHRLAETNMDNSLVTCVLRCRIILFPLSNRLETSALQRHYVWVFKHTALYCH